MKVTVSRDNLLLGLRRVLAVVSSRTTFPVLSNVLLEAEDNSLSLSTTDLEVSIQTSIPAFVEEAGSTTLPAKKFAQIVGALPEGDISLVADENHQTAISCSKSFFKIVGLDANEFPRDSEFVEDWSFDIPADEFRRSFLKVSYATSADETRHVLNGVLMSVRGGVLTIAATDGRRLALIERPLEGNNLPDGDVILPAKLVAEIEKTLEGDEKVGVKMCDSRVVLEMGTTQIASKLVEGTYPNYRQVVPENFKHSVAIERASFADALNRVSMVVSESSAAVKVKLEKSLMTVSATSTEFGEAKEPLDMSYDGDNFEIAFNPVFFSDPLRHLECDQLIIQFNDQYSPVALSGDEGFLYVVMPMRG